MEQLTEDHSLVNELLKSGKLSEAEAHTHPQRGVITRAVGTDPDVDVDAFSIDAEDGDVFLICSDGLTDMVEDEDILELVGRHRDDLDKAVKALVAAANRGGGEDNITAVAFRISADSTAEQTMQMPALTADEPDEQTREYPEEQREDTMVIPPGAIGETLSGAAPAAAAGPGVDGRRVRIVFIAVVLLLVAAGLLIWGLAR